MSKLAKGATAFLIKQCEKGENKENGFKDNTVMYISDADEYTGVASQTSVAM